MSSLSSLTAWIPQFVLVVIPLLTGFLAWKTATHPTKSTHGAPSLNGTYGVISTLVERIQTLQDAYNREHARVIRLEEQLDACLHSHSAEQPAKPVKPARPSRKKESMST